MRNIMIERTIAAPRASVWAVLADYPNIAAWNDGVQRSHTIGEAVEGRRSAAVLRAEPLGGDAGDRGRMGP